MNPGCNNCMSYPFDCPGAQDGADIAGCITLPKNTTCNSAMIDNDIEDDYEEQYLTDWGSLPPVDKGRDYLTPAEHRRVDARPAVAGSPAGLPLSRGARPFGFFSLDPHHSNHHDGHCQDIGPRRTAREIVNANHPEGRP